MVKKVLLAGVLVCGVLALPRPALAAGMADGDPGVDPEVCVNDFLACCDKASKIDNFWSAWMAALDCEFKFTKCAGKIVGELYAS